MQKHNLLHGTASGGFNQDEIINAKALLDQIASSDKLFMLYLREYLSKAQLLPPPAWSTAEPAKFTAALVDELNKIIGGEPFYSDVRFAGIKLSSYTRKLRRKNPTGAKLVKLHKLLLMDALPTQFRRSPGRGKIMEQQQATVHAINDGKWVVLVTLVEPREFAGKMRSGRQKFERQTQKAAIDLCADINNVLLGKQLARQMTPEETNLAKELFWELLEPEHPEWIQHLEEMVHHCEETGFRVDANDSVPTILFAAKLFWEEHVRGLEPESRMNFRNAFGFMLPVFAQMRCDKLTDPAVRLLTNGKGPLMFWKTSWKKKQTSEEAEKRLWDTPMKSKCRRPWTHEMKVRFTSCVRKFKTWMHESLDPVTEVPRNWCPPTTLTIPKPPKVVTGGSGGNQNDDAVMDYLCKRNPALTIPQAQALLDISHIAFDGRFAGFYSHGMFGGSRVKETKKMGVAGFNGADGTQAVSTQSAKTDQARESTLTENIIVILTALDAAGLYTDANMQPNGNQRAVLHVLAGFSSNAKQVLERADRERKRLAAMGIQLPQYNWGIPYPKNALRRTAISMHYKLFGSIDRTVEWAGNSGDVFRPFYKRLVSKDQAMEYWIMLPSYLKAASVKVHLPSDHKLESAMTPAVTAAVSTASQAAQVAVTKLMAAKAATLAARPAELKAKRAIYNKRAILKRKAKELAARQAAQGGVEPAPTIPPATDDTTQA